jgi:hypothetical protein
MQDGRSHHCFEKGSDYTTNFSTIPIFFFFFSFFFDYKNIPTCFSGSIDTI